LYCTYLRVERAEEGLTASLRPEMELPERPFTATGWTATRDAIAASCVSLFLLLLTMLWRVRVVRWTTLLRI
jgi:hypothetical protein